MEWKNMHLSNDYEVSSDGKVRNKATGRLLTLRNNNVSKHLFFECYVFKNGIMNRKSVYIHKAVAIAFIEKTDSKHRYVTHIDGDCSNNNVENLRWITASEHAKKVVNPSKSWQTRRKRYGISGGSIGRPKKNKL